MPIPLPGLRRPHADRAAASATVGLMGREGATLRKTILPTMYYLAALGALGMIAVYLLDF